MKHVLSFLITGSLLAMLACNNQPASTDAASASSGDAMAAKNLENYHKIDNAFSTGDISQIDDLVAADFVDHTDKGDMGRDSLKAMITMMHNTMPDVKSETVRALADSQYVFALMHWTGTSNGNMGMPSGPVDMKAIEVVRYSNGKAVEHWTYMEPSEMMKMMPQQSGSK